MDVPADGRAHMIVQTSSVPQVPGSFRAGAQELAYFTDGYQQIGSRSDRVSTIAGNTIRPPMSEVIGSFASQVQTPPFQLTFATATWRTTVQVGSKESRNRTPLRCGA